MIKINSLFFLFLLASSSSSFSVRSNELSEQSDPSESTVPETKRGPTFLRSSLRKFDDFFPDPFGTLDDFFSSPFTMGMDIMPFFDEIDRHADMIPRTTRISPSYEITEDENEVKVVLDVPGVRSEDITLAIENEGKTMHLTGKRIKNDGDSISESRFDKRFTLSRRIDENKVNANLSDGVLTIVAPKLTDKKAVRKVFISEL